MRPYKLVHSIWCDGLKNGKACSNWTRVLHLDNSGINESTDNRYTCNRCRRCSTNSAFWKDEKRKGRVSLIHPPNYAKLQLPCCRNSSLAGNPVFWLRCYLSANIYADDGTHCIVAAVTISRCRLHSMEQFVFRKRRIFFVLDFPFAAGVHAAN